jgi:opacity protein-like surface antigen
MRRGALHLFCIALALSLSALAQDNTPRFEIGLQGNGFFTKSSGNRDVQQSVSENGGFLIDARYSLNRWISTDVAYGRNRVTNRYTGAEYSTIQSSVHQVTGGVVLNVPLFGRFTPYVLAEGGALEFNPTGSAGTNIAGAHRQAMGTFAYGGGIDYALTKWIGLRAEYRGLVYNSPDFDVHGLDTNTVTHTAEPSAGVVIRF